MNPNSINQNLMLPNFRNVGVMLRILLIVNLLCFLAAFLRSGSWAELMREWADISSVSQLLLLASLLFFALLDDWLHELPYFVAATVLFFIEMLLAAIAHWFGESFHYGSILHYWVFSLLTVSFLLWYLNLRSRALSPALAEAR